MKDPDSLPLVASPKEEEKYNDAIEHVREYLPIFANIRGGRLRASPMIFNRKQKKKQAAGPRLPSLMAMVPSIVASSVAARWQPQTNRLHDPANGDPSKSSAALWDGKLSLHPDTDSSHPAYVLWKEQLEKRPPGGVARRSVDRRPTFPTILETLIEKTSD
jgi:Ca2+-transporting ATPase